MLLKLLTLFSFLWFLQSCTQSANLLPYSPQEGQGVKLTNRNDLKFVTNANNPQFGQDNDTYLDLQVGYSPIKHIGIQAGHYFYRTAESNRLSNKFSINNLAIGGYYNIPFANEKKLSNILLELYGNYSFAKNKNKHKPLLFPQVLHQSDLNYEKYFLRGNFHFLFNNKFGLGLGTNVGQIKFLNGTYEVGSGDSPLLTQFQIISENNKGNLREYSARFSYHFKNLHLHLGGSTSKVTNIDFSRKIANISFGFTVDLGGMHQSIQNMTSE